MSLKPELLEILVCPKCKGDLEYRTGAAGDAGLSRLRDCVYSVDDGIPVMLVDEAKPL